VILYPPDEAAPPDVMLFEPEMGSRVIDLAERLSSQLRTSRSWS